MSVCRKHQKTKQDKLKQRHDEEAQKKPQEETQEGHEETSEVKVKENKDSGDNDDDEGARAPPNKRRRGNDGPTASECGESSTEKPSSKDIDDKSTEKTGSGESSKAGHIALRKASQKTQTSRQFIQKFPSDWIDTLAKVVESTITKVPK